MRGLDLSDDEVFVPTNDAVFYFLLKDSPEFGLHIIRSVFPDGVWELDRVSGVDVQEVMQQTPNSRGLVLDYFMKYTPEGGVPVNVNIEMQSSSGYFHPNRVRYHLSVLDVEGSKKATEFEKIPGTASIFLCNFDPIPPEGLARYDVKSTVEQLGHRPFGDQRVAVLLNLKAKELEQVGSRDLVNVVEFMRTGVGQDEMTSRMEDRVYSLRKEGEVRNMIMQLGSLTGDAYYAGLREGEARSSARSRAEGRAEGIIEGRAEGEARVAQLMKVLVAAGRMDLVLKVADDPALRAELYRQYGIE